MSSQMISIKKVIQTVLGPNRAAKYLQKPDVNSTDSGTIYQAALTHLLSGKTEKAIIHVVYGLDLERSNNQMLHLCKTMLLSISEYLFENNSEVYRQKFPDLFKAEVELKKKLKELEEYVQDSSDRLKEHEKDLTDSKPTFFSLNKFFIVYYFKKKRLTKLIQALEANISDSNDDLAEIKKSLKHIVPLVKVDEYSKILGLIIEVCTFPTRYEWVLSKK